MTDPSLQIKAPSPSHAPASPATPPVAATAETLVLVAPAPVAPVAPAQAQTEVTIDPADQTKLDQMVSSYLDAVSTLDTHSQEFTAKVDDISKLGDDDIRASAAVSNRLLDKPMAAMTEGGLSQASSVSKSLVSLRRQVEDLDPSKQGDLLSPRKLLGLLPFGAGNKLEDYFARYQSSQGHINAIITSLYQGQDELGRDTASVEQEKVNLWAITARLRQYAYLAETLDRALTAKVASIEASDPERAKVLNEDMLFYLRQKRQDLLTQLAVSVQGYLALDVIRRNNTELIKGVERATTTTVSALRTAVIVAQALSDQKLVLDQITALNATTSNLIESTSTLLKQQSGSINEQAASATVDLSKLQTAFDNIYATMDEIDSFKIAALENMQKTVTALSTEIAKSQAYLDRVRATESGESGSAGKGTGLR